MELENGLLMWSAPNNLSFFLSNYGTISIFEQKPRFLWKSLNQAMQPKQPTMDDYLVTNQLTCKFSELVLSTSFWIRIFF